MIRKVLWAFGLLVLASIALRALGVGVAPPLPDAAGDALNAVFPRARSPVPLLGWTLALLGLVRLSLRNMRGLATFGELTSNGPFVVSALAGSSGLFLLNLIPARGALRPLLDALALPLPDWDQLLFGASHAANPLLYSALVPVLLAPLAVRFAPARYAIAGLTVGYAATLANTAWLGAPPLMLLGSGWLAVPWLVGNAIGCLFLARGALAAGAR